MPLSKAPHHFDDLPPTPHQILRSFTRFPRTFQTFLGLFYFLFLVVVVLLFYVVLFLLVSVGGTMYL